MFDNNTFADAPDEFGLIQVYWGDGKGKTTAALGTIIRAAGHGYRVHMLQFLKTVEEGAYRPGEYTVLDNIPNVSRESIGAKGWHWSGQNDKEFKNAAMEGIDRINELFKGAKQANLANTFSNNSDPRKGVHLLVLDELLYAVERNLVEESEVRSLLENKPEQLEVIVTGGHQRPDWITEIADLISHVENEKHPSEAGYQARQGSEY